MLRAEGGLPLHPLESNKAPKRSKDRSPNWARPAPRHGTQPRQPAEQQPSSRWQRHDARAHIARVHGPGMELTGLTVVELEAVEEAEAPRARCWNRREYRVGPVNECLQVRKGTGADRTFADSFKRSALALFAEDGRPNCPLTGLPSLFTSSRLPAPDLPLCARHHHLCGCFMAACAGYGELGQMAEALRVRGIATWNVEYRRLGQAGGGRPGMHRDVGDAVDFARTFATGCASRVTCTSLIPCPCVALSRWRGRPAALRAGDEARGECAGGTSTSAPRLRLDETPPADPLRVIGG
jgi:hypothetical protein